MLNTRMRICSILKQAKEQGVEVTAIDFSTITNEKAIDLLKKVRI